MNVILDKFLEELKVKGFEPRWYDYLDYYLTNIDLEIFKEHYDITNEKYIDGYMFKGKVGLFERYINKWIKIKLFLFFTPSS